MHAQPAVRVGLGLVFLAELVFSERFGIVLASIGHNGRTIQTEEGCIDNAQFSQVNHLALHGPLEKVVIQVFEESEIRPVRRQGFRDIKAAVVRDETVVFQIVLQIADVLEALALHDDSRAKQRCPGESRVSR